MKHSRVLSKSEANISKDRFKSKEKSRTVSFEHNIGGEVENCGGLKLRDATTLTDLWCREDDNDSEVHLISLLEERIPRYTLRADTLTNFAGYENEDWAVKTPCLSTDFDPDLSTDLMEQTFKYFLVGGARLSQVTQTYNDSRALTLLLEEKERDLEIASEIGKILVQRVRNLERTVEKLTGQTEKTKAQVTSLQRELTLRDSLLRVYVKDFDSDSEPEEGDTGAAVSENTSLKLTSVNVEAFRSKVRCLQTENEKMAASVERIEGEMEEGQDREDRLVTDCIEHLLQMNYSIQFLREEVDSKTDLIARQQEDLAAYLERTLTLEAKTKQLSVELKSASRKVSESEEQKRIAMTETEEWRRRYGECLDLLQAAQEETKKLQKGQRPASVIHRNYSSTSIVTPFLPMGSLASELHDSQKKDLFYHLGYSPSITGIHSRKVMNVARSVSRSLSQRALVASESQIFRSPGSERDDLSSPVDLISDKDSLESQCGSSGHTSIDMSDSEFNEESQSEWSQNQRSLVDFNHLSLGQPGIPGSNDLDVALIKLNIPEMSPSRNVSPRNCASPRYDAQSVASPSSFAEDFPFSFEVPRSHTSSVTNESEHTNYTIAKSHIPEKLQIIKPMEGSLTLNHWKALAVPNLLGVFEFRPGVQTKGQPLVQLFEDEVVSLSDYEEDPVPSATPTSPDSCSSILSPNQTSDKISDVTNDVTRTGNKNSWWNLSRDKNEPAFEDTGSRTLPEIVTTDKTTQDLAQVPKSVGLPSCSIM